MLFSAIANEDTASTFIFIHEELFVERRGKEARLVVIALLIGWMLFTYILPFCPTPVSC